MNSKKLFDLKEKTINVDGEIIRVTEIFENCFHDRSSNRLYALDEVSGRFYEIGKPKPVKVPVGEKYDEKKYLKIVFDEFRNPWQYQPRGGRLVKVQIGTATNFVSLSPVKRQGYGIKSKKRGR